MPQEPRSCCAAPEESHAELGLLDVGLTLIFVFLLTRWTSRDRPGIARRTFKAGIALGIIVLGAWIGGVNGIGRRDTDPHGTRGGET
jgi:hypothetical protein